MKISASPKSDNPHVGPRWVEEMRKTRVELEYKGLGKYVESMDYNGNWDGCSVNLHHFLAFEEVIPWQEIEAVCKHHLSQFDVDGHGVCFKESRNGERG
jgi:hypothetical protein